MKSLRTLVLVFPLVFCACASASTPRIRVARDFGCPAEQTSMARTGKFRWEVIGCGRSATYVCTYPVRDCWREGEVQSAQH